MSRRPRALAAAVFVALHLAIFAPKTGAESGIVYETFYPVAEGTLDGAQPYSDFDFEYPPFALPLGLVPAALTDDVGSFTQLFSWEMLLVDIAIVLLLVLAAGRRPRKVWAALGVYTAGIVLLSVRARSGLEVEMGEFTIHRFDLVPAALVLGAALARRAGRSATWSALLATSTAVKAFPAALFPPFARGEPSLGRVAVGALVPLASAALLVIALGDEFGSAITYHTERDLQIETVGASALLIADALGATAHPATGAGSWNLDGTAAETLRIASLVAMLAAYVIVVRQVWVRRIEPLEASVVVLAPLVILAPVLSPQFLIWLLPVSALVYGLRAPNLILVAACFLTGLVLTGYSDFPDLTAQFVLPQLARNGLLLAYLVLVLAPLIRPERAVPQPAAA